MRHHLSRPALRLLSFVTGVCVLTGVSLRGQQTPAAVPLQRKTSSPSIWRRSAATAFEAVKWIHARGLFELLAGHRASSR
jgi:hypothetical protein